MEHGPDDDDEVLGDSCEKKNQTRSQFLSLLELLLSTERSGQRSDLAL